MFKLSRDTGLLKIGTVLLVHILHLFPYNMDVIPFRFIRYLMIFMVGNLVLAACVYQPIRPAPESQQAPLYLPPTIIPSPTVVKPTQPPATTQLAGSSGCTNVLSFIADVTIPDGTAVTAGSTMDKRWEVDNSGTCNWDDTYKLRLIAGPEMGAQTELALFPARSHTRAVIRILFTAPDTPGTYRSAWQAFDPDGQPFGDPFYIEIVVE
jgi:hypothetical protein